MECASKKHFDQNPPETSSKENSLAFAVAVFASKSPVETTVFYVRKTQRG